MIELPEDLVHKTPWDGALHPICLSYTFSLRRNISPFCFPMRMDALQLEQCMQVMCQVLCEHKEHLFLPAELVNPVDKELLCVYFLCDESFQNAFKGQGFFLSGDFFARLNIQDHLHLKQRDVDLEKGYQQLLQWETVLGAKFPFAHNASFGYLTADPRVSGTALQVAVYLHLPAISYLNKVETFSLQQNSSQMELSPLDESGVWVMHNQYTLGLSEEDILREVRASVLFWIALEEQTREQLKNNLEAKDAVSRAYGVLTHAELVQTKEALHALGLLKWGADMGWVSGFSAPLFHQLFFGCQRPYLAKLFSVDEGSTEKLALVRASYLRKALSSITIL